MKMALVMIKPAAMVSKALPGPGGALPRNISSPPEFQLLSRSCARKQTARFQVEKTFPTESLQNTRRCLAKFRHLMQLKARFYGTTVHIRSIKTIVNNYNNTQHECLNGIRREHKCTNAIQHVPTRQQDN